MPQYNPPLRDMQFVMHELLGAAERQSKEIEETSQHPHFHLRRAMNSTAKGPEWPW